MLRCLYTAATGMEAQELKMDVISNNLANTSTTGFKRVRAEFEDLLSDTVRSGTTPDPRGGTPPEPLQVGLGVRTVGTTRSLSQGDMLNTGNPLDVAIQGNGYLRVTRVSGDYAYTRAGNLTQDDQGRICTQNGELVEPNITIPTGSTAVTIAQDGTVTATEPGKTTPSTLGQLELSQFTNPEGLESVGYNLFIPTPNSGQATYTKAGEQGAGTFAQGYLENSNVSAVVEMIDMISTQRGYELNSKVIQTADQMLQKLTSLR